MSKTVTPLFAAALAAQVKTFCLVMKVGPFPLSGLYIGLTSLNRDIFYDDGTGGRWYYATTGAQMSQLQSKNDLSVNNGDVKTLLKEYPGQGITEAMIDAGLSGVRFVINKVNWMDTSPEMGHEWMASGPIGEARLSRNGMIALETRSWSDYLRQNSVCERDSLTCRCKHFGSQYGDELFPCTKDISGLWVYGKTVATVGDEPVRVFTVAGLTEADGFFAPGLVKVVTPTSRNYLMQREIGTYDFDADTGIGSFDLKFPFRYPLEEDDELEMRPGCTREWGRRLPTDPIKVNSCLFHENHPMFRGEPKIQIANWIALTVPGAASGGW